MASIMQHLKKSILLGLLIVCGIFPNCHRDIQKTRTKLPAGLQDFKVVGYLLAGNFELIDQVDLHSLTHLDLAFANPNQNGTLIFPRAKDIPGVVRKAHQAGLQVYLSIAGGGIDEEQAGHWLAVLQPEKREAFISQIVEVAEQYQLDGIDVDIEWNLLPTIGELYTPFVVELKEALHARGKGISTALNVSGLHPAVTQESLEAYDFINVMVYDKTGTWRPHEPGPHAPYHYAEEAWQYWTQERKIPAEKLTLGVPFYGYDFDSVKSIRYRQLVQQDAANAYRDELGAIYYNGMPTLLAKTQLAMKSFGGLMIWEITYDAPGDLSLLRAINQTLYLGACPGGQPTTYFADADGDGSGDLRKPRQACAVPQNYVSNNQDCDDTDKEVHPGALEIPDGKDNDCDGIVDE